MWGGDYAQRNAVTFTRRQQDHSTAWLKLKWRTENIRKTVHLNPRTVQLPHEVNIDTWRPHEEKWSEITQAENGLTHYLVFVFLNHQASTGKTLYFVFIYICIIVYICIIDILQVCINTVVTPFYHTITQTQSRKLAYNGIQFSTVTATSKWCISGLIPQWLLTLTMCGPVNSFKGANRESAVNSLKPLPLFPSGLSLFSCKQLNWDPMYLQWKVTGNWLKHWKSMGSKCAP